jgi:hypothetical protein
MADESSTPTVTSEKKKDPRRVEAGKRLAVLSKAARERKKKEVAEPKESFSSDSLITYIGVVIALVSLVLAYTAYQRETEEPEPQYIPKTVVVTRKPDEIKLDSLE